MEKNNIVKIIIPLIMICIIGGIWFVQNQPKTTDENIKNNDNNKMPLEITSVDLEKLSKHNLPTIIDFGADECVPCKEMYPVLVTLNEEMQGKAIIQFIDVWKYPEESKDFPVQLIPTQLFINADGTPYVPSDEIANTIQFSMYSDKETQEHIYTTHQGGLSETQMKSILKDMGVK